MKKKRGPDLAHLVKEWEATKKQVEAACFPTIVSELQERALHLGEQLTHNLTHSSTMAFASQKAELGNQIVALRMSLRACLEELKMWIALGRKEPSTAWDSLITAQGVANTCCRNPYLTNQDAYVSKLQTIEALIFPPQIFLSIGMIIKKAECNICGESFRNCDHIGGEYYDGVICRRIITEAQPEEISIVEEPADKRCRVDRVADGSDWVDTLTRVRTPKESAETGDFSGYAVRFH